ncbi:MAG TPA: flagellar basal body-associated FliL family protein [Stellaceae bacterium]|nr:flagellar basal body-associated FliL family protein [Stellaceae bacterium]
MARQLEKARPGTADKRKGPAAEPDAAPVEAPKHGGKRKLIILAAVVLIVLLGGGGAYFYLFAGGKPGAPKEAAPAQPFFVEVKPFVVTMKAADDSMHYVQLALSLKVPGEEAVAAANTVMPEILDMIRQSVLGFKIDDLQTQEGVEKLRAALLVQSNRVLLQALGKDKMTKLGAKGRALVGNIFFQNLVIE